MNKYKIVYVLSNDILITYINADSMTDALVIFYENVANDDLVSINVV